MVVLAGETEKFAPLALVPIDEPPVGIVYHCIVFPAEVAFRLEVPPAQIVDGLADTEVGAPGKGLTVTDTDVRVALGQPAALSDSAKYVVEPAGETAKSAPLALVPIAVPPEATVYHCIVFPADVALRLDELPAQIAAGVAVTEVGAAGKGLTVTVTEVRVALIQPAPVNASA